MLCRNMMRDVPQHLRNTFERGKAGDDSSRAGARLAWSLAFEFPQIQLKREEWTLHRQKTVRYLMVLTLLFALMAPSAAAQTEINMLWWVAEDGSADTKMRSL